MNLWLKGVVLKLIEENPDAKCTFKILCKRYDKSVAMEEIGRALLACVWEAYKFPEVSSGNITRVLSQLRDGATTTEIFAKYDQTFH